MLHIRLTKNRVICALLDLADINDAKVGAAMEEHRKNRRAISRWRIEAVRLREGAKAVEASVGDVYVDMEMWDLIKDHYNG